MTSFMSSVDALRERRTAPPSPSTSSQGEGAAGRCGFADGLDVTCLALAGSADESGHPLDGSADVVAGRHPPEDASRSTTPRAPAQLPRRRLPDASSAAGPTTSPIPTRSSPTSPTPRTSNPCIRAGRTRRSTKSSKPAQKEMDAGKRAAQYKRDPGHLHGSAADHSALRVALSGGVPQVGEGLRAQIPLGNNIFVGASVEK